MTDAPDPHDPALDAAWRAHVRDEPSRALDDAILAAAHRAVQSAPRVAAHPAARWRAWAPLAVAATLGVIAFGVVELAPHEPDATRAVIADAPVAAPKPAEPARNTPAPARGATDATTAAAPAPVPSTAAPPTFAAPQQGAPAAPRSAGAVPATPEAVTPAVAPPPAAHAPPPAPKLQAPQRGATALSGELDRAAVSARSSSAIEERERAAAAPKDALAKREGAQNDRKDAANVAPAPQPFPAAPPVEAQRELAAGAEPKGEPLGALRRQELFAQKQAAQSAGGATGRAAELSSSGSGGKAGTDSALAPSARSEPAAAPAPRVDQLTAQESASVMAREPPATGNDARAKAVSARSPDDYVRDIRRLRGEGRDADAALALAAFRAAYADADTRLPEDLRAWARGVARP